jgi:hypothetical protein
MIFRPMALFSDYGYCVSGLLVNKWFPGLQYFGFNVDTHDRLPPNDGATPALRTRPRVPSLLFCYELPFFTRVIRYQECAPRAN